MLNSWSDILVTTGDEKKHEKEKRKKKNPWKKKLEEKEEFQTPQGVQMMVEMDWHSSYIE